MSGNPGKSKWLYSKLFEQISIAFQRLLLEPLKTLESLCLYLEEEEHKSPSTLIRWLKDLNVFVSWGANRLRTNRSNHHLSSSLRSLFILSAYRLITSSSLQTATFFMESRSLLRRLKRAAKCKLLNKSLQGQLDKRKLPLGGLPEIITALEKEMKDLQAEYSLILDKPSAVQGRYYNRCCRFFFINWTFLFLPKL